MVTCAFFARDAERDAAGAGILRAEGLVPHYDGDLRLRAQGICEARRASSRRVGTAFLVKRLADDDETRFMLGRERGHLRGVHCASGMFDHCQRGRDGGGGVAEGESDALAAVVNCEDSHAVSRKSRDAENAD